MLGEVAQEAAIAVAFQFCGEQGIGSTASSYFAVHFAENKVDSNPEKAMQVPDHQKVKD